VCKCPFSNDEAQGSISDRTKGDTISEVYKRDGVAQKQGRLCIEHK
jgi:hypothetical protein